MRSTTLRTQTIGVAAAALVLLFFAVPPVRAQAPNQLKPQGYVNDFANVLSRSAKEQLTALCAEVDEKAHAQIAVVTVKSLDGRSIEDFSIDLATQWHIGPRKSDRGILILLAVDDRQYKFEVGYGLEPILPDGKIGGFGRDAVPYLRERDYDAALLLMTRRVAEVIAADRGVALSGSPAPPPSTPGNEVGSALFVVLLLVLLGLGPLFALMRAFALSARSPYSRGRRGTAWWIGSIIGAGWGGGGGFGGSFGGGGGGFGGFGGGSFGGGGASGSW